VNGPPDGDALVRPWASAPEAILAALGVDPDRGLDPSEVAQRRRACGPNQLALPERRSVWSLVVAQFESVVVALLAAAALLSLALGQTLEGAAIGVVLVTNAVIGFATERHAVRSMEALRALARTEATVRRDRRVVRIPADELVPGDVVLVEAGDVVGADLRLFEASKLQANEAALTGESMPVEKRVEPVVADAPLEERACCFYQGTAVARGAGEGVVVATGMATELGKISALVETARPEATPLEKRIERLGRRLVGVTLALAVLVGAVGIAGGREPWLVIETAIALAVATVPEGLPIVATLALARGLWRMARRRALVEELAAVETLGSTSLILCDKTGTLTENRMTATALVLASGEVAIGGTGLATRGGFTRAGRDVDPRGEPDLREALEIAVLCSGASLHDAGPGAEPEAVGDPTEVALLVAGAKAGLRREDLLRERPEVREVAFDPEVRMMATVHAEPGGYFYALKGSPEALLELCSRVRGASGVHALDAGERSRWIAHNRALAARGLRCLAVASKRSAGALDDPFRDAVWAGVFALLDPPRASVRAALQSCRAAGIRVAMVTGDQAPTARTVAEAVGLLDPACAGDAGVVDARAFERFASLPAGELERVLGASVVARASPKQKLELIALFQGRGEIVAMTGDGVNDAPALRQADIGVAMGLRGTQVAREAAAMVLQDDELGTIVAAVEEGRAIFANLRKFVLYLLSCNASEILVVGLASLASAPLPILPLQILFLNLVTDVFPAVALGAGEGDAQLMQRPPRAAREEILGRREWRAIALHAVLITAAVLGAMALASLGLGMDLDHATSVSFLTLASAQLWHVFNMREAGTRVFRNEITRNPWIWGALALCAALLLSAAYAPGLRDVLDVHDPGLRGWAVVLGLGALPTLAVQLAAAAASRRQARSVSGAYRARAAVAQAPRPRDWS